MEQEIKHSCELDRRFKNQMDCFHEEMKTAEERERTNLKLLNDNKTLERKMQSLERSLNTRM